MIGKYFYDFFHPDEKETIARTALRVFANKSPFRQFINRNVCKDGNEVFLSTSQFSALFKAQTGKTFVEYLTDHRIQEACRLLKTTDLRTYEIAERVGYSDGRYFSHVFKKATGVTSSEYRSNETG